MCVDGGALRQAAVVAVWLAAGLLIGGLLLLQFERIASGNEIQWKRSSGS